MPSASPRPQASARSPFAGCAILITAVLVMVFLIGFSVLALFRQFNAISRFTAEKPAKQQVEALDGREGELNSLAERLELFRQQLGGEAGTRLELSPEELNLAIAAYKPFKDLRETFRVLSADDGLLRIAISFPLNGKPRLSRDGESGLVTSDLRYLNGVLVAKPALLKRELVLQIHKIEVPGAAVPREFVEQMSPYRITERYVGDPVLGPAMARLTRVEVAGGKLVLARVPGETPKDAIGEDQVDRARNRFLLIFGGAACLFLLFAGTILFIGLRARSGNAG